MADLHVWIMALGPTQMPLPYGDYNLFKNTQPKFCDILYLLIRLSQNLWSNPERVVKERLARIKSEKVALSKQKSD